MTLRRAFVSGLVAFLSLADLGAGAAQRPYRTLKGTEILWDKWGVPHVFAKSVPDMFFCYGWAQAEAHGNLLLHAFGNSRGRAAEYFGRGSMTRICAMTAGCGPMKCRCARRTG